MILSNLLISSFKFSSSSRASDLTAVHAHHATRKFFPEGSRKLRSWKGSVRPNSCLRRFGPYHNGFESARRSISSTASSSAGAIVVNRAHKIGLCLQQLLFMAWSSNARRFCKGIPDNSHALRRDRSMPSFADQHLTGYRDSRFTAHIR